MLGLGLADLLNLKLRGSGSPFRRAQSSWGGPSRNVFFAFLCQISLRPFYISSWAVDQHKQAC